MKMKMKVMARMMMILLIFVSCNGSKNRDDLVVLESKQLFSASKLQDSLDLFLNSIDSIPNPYGAGIEYMVRCIVVGCDTLLYFHAATDFTPAHMPSIDNSGKESYDTIIGGIIYRQKPIIVRYHGIDSVDVIQYNILDIDIGKRIDSLKIPIDNPQGWDAPMSATYKKYKFVHPDSLFLLKHKHLGKLRYVY